MTPCATARRSMPNTATRRPREPWSARRRGWGLNAIGNAALALCCVHGTTGTAEADVATLAPQQRDRVTIDGWTLGVALSGESINTVPNLAGAQNSREAFVTLSAVATINGAGANPVTAGNFEAGYQVGCQTDVSQGLQIGGTGQLTGSIAALPQPTLGGGGALGGYLQTALLPGVQTTLKMGSMPLVAHLGHLDMQDVHLKVDACGGPVTVRSYATMAVATDVQQTQLSVYGDPMVIR